MSSDEDGGVNWVQITAAALAAMSSAVLLSTLGVAGTIVGAAIGSITASLAGVIYGRGLDVSRQQVVTQAAALRRVSQARSDVDAARASVQRGDPGANTSLRRADEALSEAEEALEPGAEGHPAGATGRDNSAADEVRGRDNSAGERVRGRDNSAEGGAGWSVGTLPWKRIGLVAVGVFVAVMVAITAFELLAGRAISTYTGGTDRTERTTVPGLGGDRSPAGKPTDAPSVEPTVSTSPEESSSDSPSESPSEPPSESPAPEPSPSSPLPSEVPSPSSSLTVDPSDTVAE